MPYLRMWCSTEGYDSSLYLMSCQAIWRLTWECDALLGEWCPTRRNSLAEHVIPTSAYWFFTSECDAWLKEVMPIEDYTAPLANTMRYTRWCNALPQDGMLHRIRCPAENVMPHWKMWCPTEYDSMPEYAMPTIEDVRPHRMWCPASESDAPSEDFRKFWSDATPDVMLNQRIWCATKCVMSHRRTDPNLLVFEKT